MKRIAIVVLMMFSLLLCTAFAQSSINRCSSSIWQIDSFTSSDIATMPVTPTFSNLSDMYDLEFYMYNDGCVKVEVSLVLDPSTVGQFELRALYDDNPTVATPASIKLGPGLLRGYQTFTFLISSGYGYHHVDVEIRGTGGNVVTRDRTVVVLHN